MAESGPRKRSGSGNSRNSGPPARSGGRSDGRSGGGRSGGPGGGNRSGGGKPGGQGGRSSGGPRRDRNDSKDSRDSRGSRGGRDSRDGRDSRSGGSRDSRDGRGGGPRRDRGEFEERKKTAGPKQWGGVARKGAAKVGEVPFDDRPEFSAEETARYEERVAKRAAEQDRRDKLRDEAREAVSRAGDAAMPKKPKPRKPKTIERKPLPGRSPQPVDTKISFNRALGETDGRKANRKLGQAAAAFEGGRFDDARKLLKPLADRAPEVPEVQELLGLSLYRMERWQQAADRLEDFRALAGTPEQNPVLADCYRALGRYSDADFFWDELREYSPSAELMTEGRIVAAGVLADQGRGQDAVRLLEQNWKRPKRPFEHHLSRAYALADLYAVVGDEPRSRELFAWIASHAPDFSDAADRAG